jgi:hypothetical protein
MSGTAREWAAEVEQYAKDLNDLADQLGIDLPDDSVATNSWSRKSTTPQPAPARRAYIMSGCLAYGTTTPHHLPCEPTALEKSEAADPIPGAIAGATVVYGDTDSVFVAKGHGGAGPKPADEELTRRADEKLKKRAKLRQLTRSAKLRQLTRRAKLRWLSLETPRRSDAFGPDNRPLVHDDPAGDRYDRLTIPYPVGSILMFRNYPREDFFVVKKITPRGMTLALIPTDYRTALCNDLPHKNGTYTRYLPPYRPLIARRWGDKEGWYLPSCPSYASHLRCWLAAPERPHPNARPQRCRCCHTRFRSNRRLHEHLAFKPSHKRAADAGAAK